MPGIAQAKLDSSGMNARPDSPTLAITPVHQERRADHVAARLEHEDEEEQDQDLRQEHDHRTDAFDHAIDQQRAEQRIGHFGGQEPLQCGEARIDRVHERLCPAEHRLEHQEHDREQQDRASHGMQRDRVEHVRPAADLCLGHGRGRRDLACAALERDDVVLYAAVGFAEAHRPVDDDAGQRRLQLVEATLAHRDGRDHRHAEFAFEHLGVELQAVALGKIDHVERDNDRQAECDQLEREAQVVVEIGGIDHHDQCVGQALAVLRAGDDVARDSLVGG